MKFKEATKNTCDFHFFYPPYSLIPFHLFTFAHLSLTLAALSKAVGGLATSLSFPFGRQWI
jgi:hypothetical protein